MDQIKAIVTDAKKTKKVDLSHMQLKEIPEQVLKIKNLEYLNLSNNNITTIPSSISNLTSLKTLDLSSNQLISIPASISGCVELETLILSYNTNLQSLPPSLTTLSNIKEVRLFENEHFPVFVRSNAKSLFRHLSDLEDDQKDANAKETQRTEELLVARNKRIVENKEKRSDRAQKERKLNRIKQADTTYKSAERVY